MKQITVLCSILLLLSSNSIAQKSPRTTTTISLMGNYSIGSYQFSEKNASNLSSENAFLKPAVGIAKQYYFSFLPAKTYLSFGLRYHANGAKVIKRPSIEGFQPFTHNTIILHYDALAVPIAIGKTWSLPTLGKQQWVAASAGFSAGISQIGSSENLTSYGAISDDVVGATDPYFQELGGFKFYSSLDASISIAPLPLKNLSFGLTASYDLTPTQNLSNGGEYGNATKWQFEKFNYTFNRRFLNLMFGINYSFGKHWPKFQEK